MKWIALVGTGVWVDEMKVWVDASSLATGVVLEVNGGIIEDAWCLCPTGDAVHIDLAELDATIKGISLARQWQMMVLHLVTDSTCVHRWISDTLLGKARIKMRAASEMLITRWLEALHWLTDEYALTIDVKLVKSMPNWADHLTRVPQRWLEQHNEEVKPVQLACATVRKLNEGSSS